MRIILAFVDLNSIVRLHCTFNRGMQTSLSAPGVVDSITIGANHWKEDAKSIYACSFLRDLDELVVCLTRKSAIQFISCLTTLNPRKLLCSFDSVGSELLHIAFDAQRRGSSPDDAQVAKLLLPSGFPNLAKLTPRLELIDVLSRDYQFLDMFTESYARQLRQDGRWHQYELPPTLTSFSCNFMAPYHPLTVESLPSTLRELSFFDLEGLTDISLIFERFTALESLILHYTGDIVISKSTTLPKSLHLISITTEFFPHSILSHPSIAQSSLISLRIASTLGRMSNVEATTLDLSTCLPATIRSLRLKVIPLPLGASHDCIELVSLPPTLTKFDVVTDEPLPSLLSSIKSTPSLSQLALVFGEAARMVLLPTHQVEPLDGVCCFRLFLS